MRRPPGCGAAAHASSRCRGERGFTLLELAVAMLIMAVLLALAIPRLPSFGRTDLEASADRLATTMTYLADEASLRGRIYRLTLDLDAEEWSVAALAPFADPGKDGETKPEFREDPDDPMARSMELPDGVEIESVVDVDGTTSTGTRAVYFLPEGLLQSVGVRFAEDGGATSVVTLDPTRGGARREETEEPGR